MTRPKEHYIFGMGRPGRDLVHGMRLITSVNYLRSPVIHVVRIDFYFVEPGGGRNIPFPTSLILSISISSASLATLSAGTKLRANSSRTQRFERLSSGSHEASVLALL